MSYPYATTSVATHVMKYALDSGTGHPIDTSTTRALSAIVCHGNTGLPWREKIGVTTVGAI